MKAEWSIARPEFGGRENARKQKAEPPVRLTENRHEG